MKKLISVSGVVLLLLFVLPSAARAQYDTSRFGFKLSGGLNYLGGGEFDKGAVGFGQTWYSMLQILGLSPSGAFASAHLGMNFGGEFIFQFSPSMGVGLGVEYISATKSSEITYVPAGVVGNYSWKSSPSAIPIKATFYYFLPSGGNLKFFFNAGLGYYFAKANYETEFWPFLTPPAKAVADTSGGGLGFHGGLGMELGLSPMLGIIAEVKGRYASFSNFDGSIAYTFPLGGAAAFTDNGKLWYTDYNYLGLGTQGWLWVSTTTPAGTAHQAKVDFSGFSFVIGFVVHF